MDDQYVEQENPVIGENDDTPSEGYIAHYGTPRHSGRYPWGSGKNPQRNRNWLQRADDLVAQGLPQKEVAAAMGMKTQDYRAMRKIYKNQIDAENQIKAEKWSAKGYSNTAIAEKLGVSEGTVRNLLNPNKKRREDTVKGIADALKKELEHKRFLDVGEGVEKQLDISADQLHAATLLLEDEGYNVYSYKLNQVTNPKQHTNMKILCPEDATYAEMRAHLGEITSPKGVYFKDFGKEAVFSQPITSIDSSRILVKYAEDGGAAKDGVIEVRPGVQDVSLGGRNYAQVRVAVDGTHYMKGMAIYGNPDDMPPGVDIIYNSHYKKGTPPLGPDSDHTVLKIMKKDPTNPFGSAFRGWDYEDADGNKVRSPMNIVNDDEDWEGWKKNLSSQFLSKQMPSLAKRQLDIRYKEFADEFDELKSLTNPTLKRQLCEDFADSCDSAAVFLKAAALPRQGSFAILPVKSLKDNEVFAPMYNDGEEVILVRHPHAGTFEIPRLKVNNKNKDAIDSIGLKAAHAIGINVNVAAQLSGADFDGDTVLVIPTKGQKLKTSDPLPGLKGFSTDEYARDPDDTTCTGKSRDGKKGDGFNKQVQMGMASNLITDMTIKNASLDEIERAVKHSMVVIDAEKHNLDWQRSERDNNIAQLREDYQNGPKGGSSTLISKAKGEVHNLPERKEVYSYNDMTDEEKERYNRGEVIYRNTGKMHKNKAGKLVPNTRTSTRMEEATDAYKLSSGYEIENIYAEHANRMKALGNLARKEARETGNLKYNRDAELAYQDEVKSLNKKVSRAMLEAPKERQATLIAASNIAAKKEANPELKLKENADKLRKLSQKEMNHARELVFGLDEKNNTIRRYRIDVTDREWDAIQAGAISDTKLKTILRYADTDAIKKRAMPRTNTGMKDSTKARARALLNSGHSPAEVAEELGISVTTLAKEFNNFKGMGDR